MKEIKVRKIEQGTYNEDEMIEELNEILFNNINNISFEIIEDAGKENTKLSLYDLDLFILELNPNEIANIIDKFLCFSKAIIEKDKIFYKIAL